MGPGAKSPGSSQQEVPGGLEGTSFSRVCRPLPGLPETQGAEANGGACGRSVEQERMRQCVHLCVDGKAVPRGIGAELRDGAWTAGSCPASGQREWALKPIAFGFHGCFTLLRMECSIGNYRLLDF